MKPKQNQAIELLAQGSSIDATASIVKVNRRTIYQWMKNQEFAVALHDKSAEVVEGLNRRLVKLNEKALDVLEAGLESRSEAIRLRSAIYLNGKLYEVLGDLEILRRLDQIEERINRNER
jgi:hypothetical protein